MSKSMRLALYAVCLSIWIHESIADIHKGYLWMGTLDVTLVVWSAILVNQSLARRI